MGGRASKSKKAVERKASESEKEEGQDDDSTLEVPEVVTLFAVAGHDGVEEGLRQRLASMEQETCALVDPPKELQALMLAWLDVTSMVQLARTCAHFYVAVTSHPAFWRRILQALHAADEDEDEHQVEKLQRRVATVLLGRAPAEFARRVPHNMSEAVSTAFDPKVERQRIKCFATVRTYPIPEAIHRIVKEDIGELVQEAYRSVRFSKDEAILDQSLIENSDEPTWLDDDAWTANYRAALFSPLRLRLEPIADNQAYKEQIAHSVPEINTGSEAHPTIQKCRIPSAKRTLKAIANLVGNGNQIMMWKDNSFKSSGLAGHRLVVMGRQRMCVLQLDYYSNYCGGPFANYDCGMG